MHSFMKEEVYMTMPEGMPNHSHKVYKLVNIYMLSNKLVGNGFSSLRGSYYSKDLFNKKIITPYWLNTPLNGSLSWLFYMDDIIVTEDNLDVIQDIKAHLDHVFGIKDLG